MPCSAALSASLFFPSPNFREITALIPTPPPTHTAITIICIGNASVTALKDASLTLYTNKLSTIL